MSEQEALLLRGFKLKFEIDGLITRLDTVPELYKNDKDLAGLLLKTADLLYQTGDAVEDNDFDTFADKLAATTSIVDQLKQKLEEIGV